MTRIRSFLFIFFIFCLFFVHACSGEDPLLSTYPRPELLKDVDNIEFPDSFFLRKLLINGKYKELDNILASYQTDYENGSGSEITVDSAYEVLGNPDPSYKEHYDAWVDAMPDSYTAYLARASFYLSLSWAKRGSGYARETDDEQFTSMYEAHAMAKKDLERVIALYPRTVVPYTYLVSIASTGGSRKEKMDYLIQGLAIDPASYILRRDMLYFLLPRWGGSYELIDLFLKDTEQYVDKNPDLGPLMGYLDYAKSWRTYDAQNYRKTIELTSSAIEKGHKSWYYNKRADAYYSLKDYESAIIDYSNAILLNPNDPDLYVWRARAYSRLNKVEETFKDYDYAIKLYPYNFDVRKYQSQELEYYKRYDEAIESIRMALFYQPNDHKLLYRMGKIFYRKMNKPKESIDPFRKAIKIKPDNPDYWYSYANALYVLKDCEVTNALDSYINICDGRKCFDKGLKWAKEVNVFLKDSYCKDSK